MLRRCTKCQIEKQPDQFNANKRAPGGLHRRCRDCTRSDRAPRREKERKAQMAKYYAAHAESIQKQRDYQAANRSKYREASRKWREANPEAMLKAKKRWEQANAAHNASKAAEYYCRKRHRSPKWLTKDQKQHIALFYVMARELTTDTGIKHSVDHIVPLFGQTVCGLHVPWNLQVLTAADNSRKQNYLDYEVQHVFRLA